MKPYQAVGIILFSLTTLFAGELQFVVVDGATQHPRTNRIYPTMEHDFSKIIQELSSQETSLKAELDQLTSKTKVIADRLAKIQSAKSSLGGPRQITKQSKKQDKQNRKAPGITAIEEIITKILREKNSVPVADLMQQVKSNLLANGQSRIGLKSLFTKVLTSPKLKTDQSQNVTFA